MWLKKFGGLKTESSILQTRNQLKMECWLWRFAESCGLSHIKIWIGYNALHMKLHKQTHKNLFVYICDRPHQHHNVTIGHVHKEKSGMSQCHAFATYNKYIQIDFYEIACAVSYAKHCRSESAGEKNRWNLTKGLTRPGLFRHAITRPHHSSTLSQWYRNCTGSDDTSTVIVGHCTFKFQRSTWTCIVTERSSKKCPGANCTLPERRCW